MEDFDKEKVLARVAKMLAIANDKAATEPERDTAMRMVHTILAKYNLTMAQATVGTGKAKQGEPRTDGAYELREYAWMRTVAQAVGNLYFCEFFFTVTRVKHALYAFVGTEVNVYTALEMTKYVIGSIDKEGMRAAQRMGEQPRGTYWRDFCKGAMIRIYARCEQLKKEKVQPDEPVASTGTALVLADVYQTEKAANLARIREMFGKDLKTRASKQARPTTVGYRQGYDFGGSVGLNTQIKG